VLELLLEAVFLGVVQGLTEFLPVSSSGHLLLSQYFLGMDQERFGLSFDAAIHTGTLLAVDLFFWVPCPTRTSRTPRCARPT
jgi:undecaprenyl-diphosphatase